jgi:hypothetical protein
MKPSLHSPQGAASVARAAVARGLSALALSSLALVSIAGNAEAAWPPAAQTWNTLEGNALHEAIAEELSRHGELRHPGLKWAVGRAMRHALPTGNGVAPRAPLSTSLAAAVSADASPEPVKVLHLRIDAQVDPESGQMTVSTVHQIRVLDADRDTLSFGVPAGFDLLSVADAAGNALIEGLEGDENQVKVELPPAVGDEPRFIDVHIALEGKPDCGQSGYVRPCSFGGNLNYVTHANYHAWLLGGVEEARATATMRISVPAEWVVAGTGRLTASEVTEEAAWFEFEHDYPTILYSFAMGRYVVSTDTAENPPVNVYVREQNAGNVPDLFSLARNILGFYETIYTPFPFAVLDVVEIANSFGGGYGPQATVMMMSEVFGAIPGSPYYYGLVQLFSHEIAHQWWGNLIFPPTNGDVILSEGLAEFSSCTHYEEYTGGSRGNFISNGMTYLYTVPKDEDIPLSFFGIGASPHYVTLAYDKASVVFDTLRSELGREPFFAGMALFAQQFGYGIADLSDLQATLEASSGRDLEPFFSSWIHGSGYPTLLAGSQIKQRREGEWEVEVSVEQVTQTPFPLTLPVWVFVEGSEEPVTGLLRTSDTVGRTTVVVNAPPSRVLVDPERVTLQRLYSKAPGDATLDGEIDGRDLLFFANRFRKDIVGTWGNNDYFYPNPAYVPRLDLNGDGRVNEADLDLFLYGEEPDAGPARDQ